MIQVEVIWKQSRNRRLNAEILSLDVKAAGSYLCKRHRQ
jgi:hypothetical protein